MVIATILILHGPLLGRHRILRATQHLPGRPGAGHRRPARAVDRRVAHSSAGRDPRQELDDDARLDLLLCRRRPPVAGGVGYLAAAGAARSPAAPPAAARRRGSDSTSSCRRTTRRPRSRRPSPACWQSTTRATLFRVLVVADNCTDRTARAAAGARARRCWFGQDPERRGKGYALAFAFASLPDRRVRRRGRGRRCRHRGLEEPAAGVRGAVRRAGPRCVQADYGVRNPHSSWRTRLMTIALAAFHGVRSVARERLGLSCGLRGNGMGFSKAVLDAHPPQRLLDRRRPGVRHSARLRAAFASAYVHEARVLGHMAVTESASRSQRRRWERGRQALVRAHVPAPAAEAPGASDGTVLLDLALDLLVPPTRHWCW